MSLDLELIAAPWMDDAPQPGGTVMPIPDVLRAWKRTLGAAHALETIDGGALFADWLRQIVASGGGEHLLTLDPIAIGDLQARWTADLFPALAALRASASAHDYSHGYGVRDATDVEAVLHAWADCIEHALVHERGLIGRPT